MSSLGDATDFGDSTLQRGYAGLVESPTRSVKAGGITPTLQNVIDFVSNLQR